ncbi:MAG: hypothetical protein NXI22_10705, partial [bacterium]|nr:hypothetical protein [bacterium]
RSHIARVQSRVKRPNSHGQASSWEAGFLVFWVSHGLEEGHSKSTITPETVFFCDRKSVAQKSLDEYSRHQRQSSFRPARSPLLLLRSQIQEIPSVLPH